MVKLCSSAGPFVLWRYGLAVVAVAATLGLVLGLQPVLGVYSPYLPFALAVMVVGRYGGCGPALAATVCSVLCSWYFLLKPTYSLTIADPDATENLALFAVVGVSISVLTGQLQRALMASRNNEEELRRFVEFAPVAIAMFDAEMHCLAASERFRQDYRLQGRELKRLNEALPDLPERWREVYRRCLTGSVERHPEDPFAQTDGSVEWVSWEMRPWYQADGNIGGVVLASADITPQKRAKRRYAGAKRAFARCSSRRPTASSLLHRTESTMRSMHAAWN